MTHRAARTHEQLYAWHTAAVAAGETGGPEIHGDEPQCGWFKCRLSKKGCWVPARIWVAQVTDADGELTEPAVMHCEVDGDRKDPGERWTWICSNPITLREFEYLTRLRRWQRVNAPHEWDPMRPVDHLSTPVLE